MTKRKLEMVVDEPEINLRIYRAFVPTNIPSLGDLFGYVVEKNDIRTLVDTGPVNVMSRGEDNADLLVAQLASVGIELGDIDAVFITHKHVDHFGQLTQLLQRSDSWDPIIYADSPTATAMTHYGAHFERICRRDRVLMDKSGLAPSPTGPRDMAFFKRFAEPVTHDINVVRGEGVVGNLPGFVITLYGHDDGQLGLLVDGYLLAGDAMLDGISPNVFFEDETSVGKRGLIPYLATLVKMHNLELKGVLGSHRKRGRETVMITDYRERITAEIGMHEARSLEIVGAIRRSEDTRLNAILSETSILGGRDDFNSRYLGLCELYGHLQALAQIGVVAIGEREGFYDPNILLPSLQAETAVRRFYDQTRSKLTE